MEFKNLFLSEINRKLFDKAVIILCQLFPTFSILYHSIHKQSPWMNQRYIDAMCVFMLVVSKSSLGKYTALG